MSGVKRAALVLHGLQAEDRAWLIAQLDEAQREPLKKSLGELAALGVPRDASLLHAVLPQETSGDEESASHERLMRASAPMVLAALQGQAVEAIAMLLRVQPWPWREAVVQQWSRDFTKKPGLLEPGFGEPGPSLRKALLDAVAERIGSAPEGGATAVSSTPAPRRAPWWQRLRPRGAWERAS